MKVVGKLVLLILWLALFTSLTTVTGDGSFQAGDQWPMFGQDTFNTGLFQTEDGYGLLDEPEFRWEERQNEVDSMGVAFADMSGNVNRAVPYSNAAHGIFASGDKLYVVDTATGEVMWRGNVDNSDGVSDDEDVVVTAPLVWDADENGRAEIFVGTTNSSGAGQLMCFEPEIIHDGEEFEVGGEGHTHIKWIYNFSGSINISSPIPSRSLDLKLIAIGVDADVHLIQAESGDDWEVLQTDGTSISTVAAVERGDEDRLAVSAIDLEDDLIYFYIFSSDGGSPEFETSKPLDIPTDDGEVFPSPVFAELDGDGDTGMEVLFSAPFVDTDNNGVIYAYSTKDSSLNWNTRSANDIEGVMEATPAVGDLNGDGSNEVVATSWDITGSFPDYEYITNIYGINGSTGDILWEFTVDLGDELSTVDNHATASPVLLDVDDDGLPEVIGCTGTTIYAIDPTNQNGKWSPSALWWFNISTRIKASPAAGDPENDGRTDLLVNSEYIGDTIADFIPVRIELDTNDPEEGERVQVYVTVQNRGNVPHNNVPISLLEDGVFRDNETIENLPAYETRTIGLDWWPSTHGQREVLVAVDPFDDKEESSEDNNNISLKLDVDRAIFIEVPQPVGSGEPTHNVSFSVEVMNNGSRRHKVTMTPYELPDGWEAGFNRSSGNVEAGETVLFTFNVTIDDGALAQRFNASFRMETNTSVVQIETVEIDVEPVYLVAISPTDMEGTIVEGQTGTYSFFVWNFGNDDDSFTVSVEEIDDWDIDHNSTVSSEPVESSVLDLLITAPNDVGEDVNVWTNVTVTSVSDPNATDVASLSITVSKPDFRPSDIKFYREDMEEVGSDTDKHPIENEDTIVQAVVNNPTSTGAFTDIQLLRNGGEVETINTFISPGKNLINFTYDGDEGWSNFSIVADPDKDVDEVEEDNNDHWERVAFIPSSTDSSFNISGYIENPDEDPVPGAIIEITVVRLGGTAPTVADGNGLFSIDLSLIFGDEEYREGELIEVSATDGTNATLEPRSFMAYSEDEIWFEVIKLDYVPSFNFKLRAKNNSAVVAAPVTVNFDLTVHNKEEFENTINLSVVPTSNWSVPRIYLEDTETYSLTIDPQSKVDVRVEIEVPDGAYALEPYHIIVRGTTSANPNQPRTVSFSITLNQTYDLVLEVPSREVDFTEKEGLAEFNIKITNRGNGRENVTFDLDAPTGLTYDSESLKVKLPYRTTTYSMFDEIPSQELLPDERLVISYSIYLNDSALSDYVFASTVTGLNISFNSTIILHVLGTDLSPVANSLRTTNTDGIFAGQAANMKVDLENLGNLDVDSAEVKFVDSTDGTEIVWDLEIKAGRSETWEFSWTPTSEGTHFLKVIIDPDDDIREENEANNEIETIFTAHNPLPDLEIENYDVPDLLNVGEAVEVEVKVGNSGFNVLMSKTHIVLFQIKGDGSRKEISSTTIAYLEAGDTKDLVLEWTPGSPGNVELMIDIDPDMDVDEVSDRNNNVSVTVLVVEEDDEGLPLGVIGPLAGLLVVTVFLAILFSRDLFAKKVGRIKGAVKRKKKVKADGKPDKEGAKEKEGQKEKDGAKEEKEGEKKVEEGAEEAKEKEDAASGSGWIRITEEEDEEEGASITISSGEEPPEEEVVDVVEVEEIDEIM